MVQNCSQIPHAEKILKISGIGENTLSGILAEMGDISRFDDVKEIQKLSGLNLVSCNSGKHNGQTKISHRGRKRFRYWLFQAAKSAVAHAEEFKELHTYYTTRPTICLYYQDRLAKARIVLLLHYVFDML